MQEDKQTIDIDTSGPGAEIELPEEKDEKVVDQPTEKEIDKTYENERETKLEDNNQSDDSSKKLDEQFDFGTRTTSVNINCLFVFLHSISYDC